MHPSKKTQIAYLKANETLTKVLSKYADLANIFLSKLAAKLPKHMKINDLAVELVNNWQLRYGPVYSLGSIELETLNSYIESNLVNSFIRLFKSPTGALIFFDKKPDGSQRLYVDY